MRTRRARFFVDLFSVPGLLALSCVLPACSAPLARSVPERELLAGGRHVMIEDLAVPRVDGPDGCGAQALATVMARNDESIDVEALGAALPWHDFGATPVDLLVEARRRGCTATIERGTWDRLRDLVESGNAPLVMFDSGIHVRSWLAKVFPPPPVMHWGVVSGVAHDDATILLAAPSARHHVIARREFLQRWADSDFCTILVTAPERGGHPASVSCLHSPAAARSVAARPASGPRR